MIKVLFVAPRFGTVHRGVEVYVEELISRLDKNLFDVTVLSLLHDKESDDVQYEKFSSIGREQVDFVFRCRVIRKILSFFKIWGSSDLESFILLRKAKRFIKNNTYDVVFPFGGLVSLEMLKTYSRSAKIVSVGHADFIEQEVLLSDYFIALTDVVYKRAKQFKNEKYLRMIPNGVDLKRFSVVPKKKESGEKKILCVGAFTKDKNHKALLDAFMLLPECYVLCLVGKGPLKKEILTHPVCETHKVVAEEYTPDKMPAVYADADIFTLPSEAEAFGIVFIEALASGLNVVANDNGRQRFVLGGVGFYVDVNDKIAYANAIQKALDINQKEHNRVRAENFSWDEIVKVYSSFLKEIVS